MKKKIFAFVVLLVMACTTLTSSQVMNRPVYIPNKKYENIKYLAKANSPYLLSYVQSNVNWYPWNAAALKKAKKENKMLLVDFGQLSCDVCREKDKNVFEDKELAKFINDNFIPIKVDINERPDIFKFYQQATEIHMEKEVDIPVTGLALPDGKPFWLADMVSKPQMSRILNFFVKQYYRGSIKIEFVAEQLARKVAESASLAAEQPSFKHQKLKYIGDKLVNNIDAQSGGIKGIGRDNKYPLSSSFKYLLRHYHVTKDDRVLEAIKITLNSLAAGGLYDHVEGGFFSSSKTHNWSSPDFSKTLANNAQLVSLYSEAYQLTKDPAYKDIVYETLEFLEKRLMTSSGSFFAGLQGHSGKSEAYYLWTQEEVQKVFDNELFAKIFCDYYNIREEGRIDGKNILSSTKNKEDIIAEYGLDLNELESILFVGKQKLLKTRNKRLHPIIDNQTVTSWNALMLKGYVDAYRAFGNYLFLERANNLAKFITDRMYIKEGHLAHSMVSGKITASGFLDDYAFTIDALIGLYQATFDETWLYKARDFSSEAIKYYHNKETGMFYYTGSFEKSFLKNIRFADIKDKQTPSSNSCIANGLYMISLYFPSDELHDISKTMISNIMKDMESSATPYLYANWCNLYQNFVIEPFEVTIVGKDYEKLRTEFDDKFLPNMLLFGGRDEGTLEAVQGKLIEGETMIYVCKNKVCKMPTTRVDEALELMVTNAN